MADNRICSVDGCGKLAVKRGWCSAHYARWRKYGSPFELRVATPPGAALDFLQNAINITADACVEWPFSRTGNGYPKIGHGRVTRLPHRIVCMETNGSPPTPKHQAAHICGNRLCVNPRHLRWATCAENHSDKIIHGTVNRGSRNGASKIGRAEAIHIRGMAGVKSQRELAREFGVSQSNISAIQTGKSWAWL
jgi:hypothetical protein